MADMVTVHLKRSYQWVNEAGDVDSYGPGEVDIPRQMAEGLQREKVDIGLPNTTQEADVHPKIIAQNEAAASTRAVDAAVKLAKLFGLDDSDEAKALSADVEKPLLQQLARNEAVASFLETLVVTQESALEEFGKLLKGASEQGPDHFFGALELLPGIGPATVANIRVNLEQAEPLAQDPVVESPVATEEIPDAEAPVTPEIAPEPSKPVPKGK